MFLTGFLDAIKNNQCNNHDDGSAEVFTENILQEWSVYS